MLGYKTLSAGGRAIGIYSRGTTQNCSGCGKEVKKTLAIRIDRCPYCNLKINRELNSAINILKRATAGQAGSHACGDLTSTSCLEQEASRIVETGTIRHEIGSGIPHHL